ncbi:GntP family permease [Irregularibacter muris]|uniref:GntP family permease n=1 Tax=Irregularibacter muris TaxID=1796619 RepID=A0AAE3L3V7_9FIRM|nr:GntP family permease [Irregularibacter muris]MCR1898908.1 GntP family permease [Irregularibacter muris]
MSSTLLVFNLVISIAIILIGIVLLKANPALSMVLASLYMGVSSGFTWAESAGIISTGFGNMMTDIGLPIGLGVILGQLLSDTGAAQVIAESIVSKFKKEIAIYAVGVAGFVLSIPVFFDVTFIILIPIGIAIAKELNKPIPFITGALSAGAAIAHSLVPPTPTPLAAGDIFGFSTGTMLIVGLIVGAIAVTATVFIYSKILTKTKYWNPEKDINHSSPVTEKLASLATEEIAASDENRIRTSSDKPGFLFSMCPIVIPVLCILSGTIGVAIYGENLPQFIEFMSNKLIAILLGTIVAYLIGYKYLGKKGVDECANEGLKTAGIVLLVTGAGGSFGAIIKATDIGNHLISALGIDTNNVVMVLLFAYFIGFIFRVAQGSGTVAGLTSMAILAPIAVAVPVHPVYIAIACLAGGNSIGHVNDSGFWVATNLSGLSVTGGLKTYTTAIGISTIIEMICVITAALLFPMA